MHYIVVQDKADFKSSEMEKDEASLYLFLTFGKKTLQLALVVALSRCSGYVRNSL